MNNSDQSKITGTENIHLNAQFAATAYPAPFADVEEIRFESEWNSPSQLSMVMNDGKNPEPHLLTSVQCYWNRDCLFVLFSGSFKKIRNASIGGEKQVKLKTLRLWETSDVYEFFIGAHAKEKYRYREFQAAPDGQWIDIAVDRAIDPDRGDYTWNSGCAVRSIVDHRKQIWKSAIGIPWESLDAEGNIFRDWECNFFRASGAYHGEELLAWSPPGTGNKCFHRTEYFGTLRLVQ